MAKGIDTELLARLRHALILLLGVAVFGISGYRVIEGWSFLDATYMTVITLTTVGFGETHPLSDAGRVFTIFLLMSGVGTATYTAFVATQLMVESRLRLILEGVGRDRRMNKLQDHVIVCGYGRVGRMICSELRSRGATFVVIERNSDHRVPAEDTLFIIGDATEDPSLQEAHIETARSLICALSNEAENVYVTLTARQLNPNIFITARADNEGMESKLLRAGANRVVCPYRTGAVRMAITTLQPTVVDFMNVVEGDDSTGLSLEEIAIAAGSPLIGQTLQEIDFRQRFGLTIIGIKPSATAPIYNPPSIHRLDQGDILLIIGPPNRLAHLVETMAKP